MSNEARPDRPQVKGMYVLAGRQAYCGGFPARHPHADSALPPIIADESDRGSDAPLYRSSDSDLGANLRTQRECADRTSQGTMIAK